MRERERVSELVWGREREREREKERERERKRERERERERDVINGNTSSLLCVEVTDLHALQFITCCCVLC